MGTIAGLVAALSTGWALRADGGASHGLMGLSSATDLGLALHVGTGALLGAVFGALVGTARESNAAILAQGVMFGLVAWLVALVAGAPGIWGPEAWSLDGASALPNLVAHLLFGGLTGLSFAGLDHALAAPATETEEHVKTSRVVVLGGGFGGIAAARRLGARFARQGSVDVVLVSEENYLLFTPLLASVASGGLQATHITVPVRAAAPHVQFRHAAVLSVDPGARSLQLRSRADAEPEELVFDHLVVALGSVPDFRGLPGVAEHALTLKSLGDATRLRDHVLTMLERADLLTGPARHSHLTFVVAGAGFAGTEAAAEVLDLVHSVLPFYPHLAPEDVRCVLVHSGERILPELSEELAEYAQTRLARRGLELVFGRRVASATSSSVVLDDGMVLDTRTLVWTAGTRPHPLVRSLSCHGTSGRAITDAAMRVDGVDNIWAIGDCAHVPDPAGHDSACPPTAQHAQRQGGLVADNVAAAISGRRERVRSFRFRGQGQMVGLGHRTAAAEVMGRHFAGFPAWLLWRSVYLSKLPGLQKKVRVALDWLLDLWFPRDIVIVNPAPVRGADQREEQRGEQREEQRGERTGEQRARA